MSPNTTKIRHTAVAHKLCQEGNTMTLGQVCRHLDIIKNAVQEWQAEGSVARDNGLTNKKEMPLQKQQVL